MEEFRQMTKDYLEILRKLYPHKNISEYTRVEESLVEFIKFGLWEPEE